MIRVVVLFFNDTATTELYTDSHTLSLHDALPISAAALDLLATRLRTPASLRCVVRPPASMTPSRAAIGSRARQRALRSEEHTSELQSLMRRPYAVFCLKKKTETNKNNHEAAHEKDQVYRHTKDHTQHRH